MEAEHFEEVRSSQEWERVLSKSHCRSTRSSRQAVGTSKLDVVVQALEGCVLRGSNWPGGDVWLIILVVLGWKMVGE